MPDQVAAVYRTYADRARLDERAQGGQSGRMVWYSDSTVDLAESHLRGGFFDGWAAPPSPEEHLQILRNSSHVVVARDEAGAVIGFVNALSDGLLAAYVPLLEVLPAHRGNGIGTELVRRLLSHLDGLYMIDVMCDQGVRPFYERLGFVGASGAAMRNYEWRATRAR